MTDADESGHFSARVVGRTGADGRPESNRQQRLTVLGAWMAAMVSHEWRHPTHWWHWVRRRGRWPFSACPVVRWREDTW